MVLGVSTGLEPIFAPVYKRRWRTGSEDVWNETIVMDPLFKEYLDAGKSVEHIVGAYDVTPEEHIKMQATVQKYIDSAVSKTCNLPADFESSTLYDEILSYIHEMKGITFYKAGSRGNEPLEALPIDSLDLDLLRKEGVAVQTESIDTCKSGVCEL
jgi:ribonucleoside-diphosphate reductase alpha chain